MPNTAQSESYSQSNLDQKVKHNNGLLLNKQQSMAKASQEHSILIVPSTNQLAYGSMCLIDIREKNILLHNICLQFNITSVLTGTGTVTNYPNLCPAWWLFQRIEILINGNIIDSIYPTEQFILQQFFNYDEDRLIINSGVGSYASALQRKALSNSASSFYYVNLQTFFDQIHFPLLNDTHNIQLRIYCDNLSNIACMGAGFQGTSLLTSPSGAALGSLNAICKITRMDQTTANNKIMILNKQPSHFFFHDLRIGTYNVASSNVKTQIVLTSITGKVALLFFVVRNNDSTAGYVYSGENLFQFVKIKDFSILNASSTNIVGGQQIPDSLALQYLNLYWSQSSYPNETALGITDNKANVYCWSFSSDPVEAIASGRLLSSHQFSGQEQLLINLLHLPAIIIKWMYSHLLNLC